jgi:hypothetical protein
VTDLIHRNVFIAWLVLILLTALSWYLSLDLSVTENNAHRMTTSTLFLLAFFKVRLVIIHFMEISTAPIALRIFFESWVVVVCSVLIAMYCFLPM